MIRAFVGVRIDPHTVRNICAALSQLKGRLPGVRWIAPENFHFTLKFLGSVQEEKIAPMVQALEQRLGLFPRFSINAKGLGVFPDLRRARTLWVGLEGQGLRQLTSEVEGVLEAFGFAPEKRAFKPHLTVARWRRFEGSHKRLGEQIAQWHDSQFGQSVVEKVILFQSVLNSEGAVYRPLAEMALADRPYKTE